MSQIETLLHNLGFEVKDESLYRKAFTHPSANAPGAIGEDYERLEFLGDAMVGLVVSELVYKHHPELDQGGLSILKAHFVKRESEASYCKQLGLSDCFNFGKSYLADHHEIPLSVYEDIFEAFIGALLLDAGLEKCHDFLINLLEEKVVSFTYERKENPKSLLQEAFQAEHRESVTYRILSESGPSHDRHFVAAVYFDGQELGRGEGKSKKEAEKAAAEDVLGKMEID